MKNKYVILIIVYLLFCLMDCCFSNIPIINAINTGYFTYTDILMSLHDSSNGYNGLLEMLVVYTLPVLLGIYYLSDKETSYCIVRYRSRAKYKQNENWKVVFVAIIFSVIHQLIDLIFAIKNFDILFLREKMFMSYTILFGIIAFLFFLETGFLYQLLHDLVRTDLIALLATFFINFAQYLIIKYSVIHFWIPGEDVLMAFEYFSGNVSLLLVIITILRSIFMIVCIYLFGQIAFEKKDIIKNEK